MIDYAMIGPLTVILVVGYYLGSKYGYHETDRALKVKVWGMKLRDKIQSTHLYIDADLYQADDAMQPQSQLRQDIQEIMYLEDQLIRSVLDL